MTIRSYVALALLVLLGGCQIVGPEPSRQEQTQILYVAAGGFFGGVHDSLTINESGLATNRNVDPPRQKQLSAQKHEQTIALFDGFFQAPEPDDEAVCADDIYHTFSYREGARARTISVWGCSLRHADEAVAERLVTIADTMRTLADRIRRQEAL